MNFLFLIISTSILMSLIILLALALFSFFPEQFSGKTRYFIWIIILIGLIIPVRPIIGNGLITIELPWQTESLEVLEAQLAKEAAASNITTENPSNISNESTVYSNANVTGSESLAPSSNTEATDTPKESVFDLMKKNLTPIALILGIWLLGAFFSFSRHIYHYYQFKKMVRRWSKPVEDLATLELFDIVKEDMGLHKKNIQLMVCPSITTPMLTGFFKPTILLPNKEIHEDEMELILEHELTHYKHKDLYINLLGTLAVSLHWFNPIVYLCYPSIQGDGEVCCDEAVLKNHDSDYRQFYGEVIISMIERNSKNQVAFTTCFYAKKLSIKRRLMAIMKTNKNKKLSFIAIALVLTLTIISGSVIAFAAPARKKYIGTNKAKAIALRDAGLKSKDVKFVNVRLETENGIKVYDVEFYKGQTEYDYDIDALTGKVVSKDLDIENFEIPGGNNQNTAPNNSQLIGLEKAKSIALTDAGLKANQVTFRKAKLDKDDGRQVYDIEFTTSSAKYDYEVDALTGKIRDKEVKAVKNNNNNNNNSNSNQVIGLEKAKNIALADARLKAGQVTFVKAKLEKEDGRQVYDVEFYFGQTEYDYEIDALTGKILEKDLDIDNFNIPNQNNNNNASQAISLEQAKGIALNHAGLSANQVQFKKARLTKDDGRDVFEIEFRANHVEYDYEIDALSGKILDFDQEREDD